MQYPLANAMLTKVPILKAIGLEKLIPAVSDECLDLLQVFLEHNLTQLKLAIEI